VKRFQFRVRIPLARATHWQALQPPNPLHEFRKTSNHAPRGQTQPQARLERPSCRLGQSHSNRKIQPRRHWRGHRTLQQVHYSKSGFYQHNLTVSGVPPVRIITSHDHTTAAKRNLGKAGLKATLFADEFCREISDSRQVPAPTGGFSYRNTAHWLTETPLPPPLPRTPHFPAFQSSPPTSPRLRRSRRLLTAGRSSPTAVSGATRQKQIPSS